MLRQRRHIALGVVAVVCVAACDAGGSTEPATVPATSPAPSALPTTPTIESTRPSDPPTTTIDPAPTATLPGGVIGLSPGGPWTLVDSAPGITTPGLVYELMPKLWVYLPVKEDVPNGITWTLNEEDRPIIEAYLQARLVYYRAITSRPMNFSSPSWVDFYVDSGVAITRAFSTRTQSGQFADLEEGVVLRPTVGGDGRSSTEALVLDCTLDGAVLRQPDGTLAAGSTSGVIASGVAATMKQGDGWKIDRVTDEVDTACA